MDELPNDIYNRVTALSEAGNVALDAGNAPAAIERWNEAMRLFPSPRMQ